MAFKMFKKDLPETPKAPGGFARFAKKMQLTPTALDGSLRGEQRRTEILESQLRDVSATAASAYDEIDDLRMRNDMLNEQVVKQKDLIDSLMKQNDESNAERQQLMKLHEEQLLANLQGQTNDSKAVEELQKEKSQMAMEMKRLKMELKGYKNLYEQEQIRNQQPEQEKQVADTTVGSLEGDISKISVSNYIDNIKIDDINGNQEQREITITGLLKRVRQLELQLEATTNEYEASLSSMRNTIMIIRDSKEYIDTGRSFRIMDAAGSLSPNHSMSRIEHDAAADQSYEKEDKHGDTFVLSNLSFLK